MDSSHYIIQGGIAGRERLRVLARVMRPTTLRLLERVGVRPGMAVLDVGCGGGDVTLEFAQVVGADGLVLGLDLDATKLGVARREAAERGFGNVAFQQLNITASDGQPEFDLVYARFLLTHLPDPAGALVRMRHFLRPGGLMVIEDIDFAGHFCHPDSAAFRRYVDLYTSAVQRRGGDANIGPRLPGLLAQTGLQRIEMHVVQPAGWDGDVKLVTPLTMESIADTVLAEGLASRTEVDHMVEALYDLARQPHTIISLPRIVQAWGSQPA
jgi:SAM-dependent methyltransferase